jgi:pilus assembly protein CpaD
MSAETRTAFAMMKHLPIAALLAPALALGACAGTPNRGLESVHQPVVTRADYAFDVNANGSGLAGGESRRLAGWLDSLHLGYGDRIAIDDPAGYGAARSDVAATVARYGLILSDDAPVTGATVAPGTIRVVVSRSTAHVPGCPDMSRVGGTDFESNTQSNQGCAINSNLAAMVANPGDLVRGQPGSTAYDPAVGTRAIDAFRKATPTGAGGTAVKSESTGGK